MEEYLRIFTKYVYDNYDINDSLIKEKYFHSLRVANIMIILADELYLNDQDILLAAFLGLFHDLGRFREVVRNSKFNNLLFDHGAYSNKILFNDELIKDLNINEEDYLLIRKVIFCHNKKDLRKNLSSREQFFANLLRDADKLDLLKVRMTKKHLNFKDMPNSIVIDNFLNNKTINLKDIHNGSDSCVLYLSFIKDLFFNESYNYAMVDGYLDDLINFINVDEDKKEVFKKLVLEVEKRGMKDVREKVRSLKSRRK